MDARKTAVAAAVIACVLWGMYGIFSRNLIAAGLDSLQVAGFRLVFAVVILAAAIFVAGKELFKVRKMVHIPVFLLFAVVVLLENFFYNEAIENVPLALGELLQMTSPFFVMFMAFFLFGEIPTRIKIAATAIALIGGCFVTGVFTEEGAVSFMGCLYAVLSGVCLAVCGVGMKSYANKGYHPLTLVFWVFTFAALITAPVSNCFAATEIVVSDWKNVMLVFGLGLVVTAVPYGLQAWSISRIDVTTVSIISVSQCVFAAATGYICFGEILNWDNILGMIIVMASLVMMEYGTILANRNACQGQIPESAQKPE